MRLFFLWGFFLMFSLSVFGQNETTIKSINKEHIDSLFAKANRLLEANEYETGLVLFDSIAKSYLALKDWEKFVASYEGICFVYKHQNDYDNCFKQATKGIEIIESNLGKENEYYAGLLIETAFPLMVNGQIDKAKENALLAAETLKKQLGRDDPKTARVYGILGNILRNKGDLNEAKLIFVENINIFAKLQGEDSKQLIPLLGNLAMLQRDIGEVEEAINGNLRVIELLKKNFGEEVPMLSYGYRQLALCYRTINDYDNTLYYQQLAIDHHNLIDGKTNGALGELYMDLGSTFFYKEDYTVAKYNLLKGINYIIEDYGDLFFPLTSGYNYLAGTYKALEQKDSAEYYSKKVINLGIKVGRPQHLNVTIAYTELAKLMNEKGDYHAGLLIAQKGLATSSVNFSDTVTFSNPNYAQIQNPKYSLDLSISKIDALIGLVNKKENNTKYIEIAENTINDFVENHGKRRMEFSGSSINQNVENEETECLINKGIFYLLDIHQLERKPEFLNQAFSLLEQSKTWELLDVQAKNAARAIAQVPDSILQKETILKQSLFEIEQQIQIAFNEKDNVKAEQLQGSDFYFKTKENKDFETFLETNYPKYFQEKYNSTIINPQDIKTILNDNQLLVQYKIDHCNQQLYLFYFDNINPFNAIKIASKPNLMQKIERFNTLLQSPTLFRKTKREEFIQLSNELYQQFIQPIENQLIDKKKLVVIGDGATHYLPFEALLKSNEIKPFHELNYLVNNYEISYHYSATLFAKSREDKREMPEGLLAFAPVFDDKDDTNAFASRNRTTIDTTYRAIDREGNFTPLKYSLVEVNTIAEMVRKQSGQTAKVLLFEEANEATLKQNIEQPYRFVHIASHSFANLKDTKFSGIACTPPQNLTAKEDGILYLGEIYNMQVPADLVVLSSCESGLGKLQSGEGLIGLNRSFIYAGVPNVIFSLWKVNDKASSDLMIDFYRKTSAGDNYAAALRKAKLNMIQNENTASPNLWSSFLLIGR